MSCDDLRLPEGRIVVGFEDGFFQVLRLKANKPALPDAQLVSVSVPEMDLDGDTVPFGLLMCVWFHWIAR